MPDERGYPLEEELAQVRNWTLPGKSVKGLVEFLESIWWAPDWGFNLYPSQDPDLGHKIMKLELHTGGWSGNEDIIDALRNNNMQNLFYFFYWEASKRGGHYYFAIPFNMWEPRAQQKVDNDA